MAAPHVRVGNKVIVAGDPMVHVVGWENYRSFDTACSLIIEDYQPDYYEELLDVDADAMRARGNNHDDLPFHRNHPALQLQVASDDVPITCVQCMCARPADQRDVFSDVDE